MYEELAPAEKCSSYASLCVSYAFLSAVQHTACLPVCPCRPILVYVSLYVSLLAHYICSYVSMCVCIYRT